MTSKISIKVRDLIFKSLYIHPKILDFYFTQCKVNHLVKVLFKRVNLI